jgi:hypothetical protein
VFLSISSSALVTLRTKKSEKTETHCGGSYEN